MVLPLITMVASFTGFFPVPSNRYAFLTTFTGAFWAMR